MAEDIRYMLHGRENASASFSTTLRRDSWHTTFIVHG